MKMLATKSKQGGSSGIKHLTFYMIRGYHGSEKQVFIV
jgi:hypothetical protein